MSHAAATVRAVGLGAAGASDPGRVRDTNEDLLYFDIERGIFLVADGVGGHAAGEVAAAIAVDVVVERLERHGGRPEQSVREAIARANNEIYQQARRSIDHAGMTCVMTVALLTDQRLTIGHVGDSRLYKLTPGGLVKMTHDHSPVGEREDAQEISEVDAMHHPRRNEVFRDVGSALRRPDDPDFIEIVHTRFEPDSAILLCSDGLTDMVTSVSIDRLVRQHAGDPGNVVRALIAAANEAGGRDNVTVLYVEGPNFARASLEPRDRHAAATAAPSSGSARDATDDITLAAGGTAVLAEDAHPDRSEIDEEPRTHHIARALARSRATWLAIGVVGGIALSIGTLVWMEGVPFGGTGRTLVVGSSAGAYPSIGDAMREAATNDLVRIEPGQYAESVVLKHGVDLAARVPGSVTLVAPPGVAAWTGVTTPGAGNTISGIRVLGRPDAPVAVGARLDGDDITLDDVVFEGNIDVAVDVRNDGGIVIRSSRFSQVRGLPLRVGTGSRPIIRQNVFVNGADEHGPAVHVLDTAEPTLSGNLFVGYAEPIGAPPAVRQPLLRGNFVVRENPYDGH